MSLRIAFFFLLAAGVTSFNVRPSLVSPSRVSVSRRLSDETAQTIATIDTTPEEPVGVPDVVESSVNVADEESGSKEEFESTGTTERYTIYIGNLPYSTSVQEIRNMVENIAEVRYVSLPKDRESDKIKGFGFVDIATEDDIPKVVDALNGFEMEGRKLRVSRSLDKDQIRSPKREVEGSKKLYVGNISYECTKEDLSEYIRGFGEVTDVFIPQDANGKPRGFAFIAVKDEDVEAVIEGANDTEFMGRTMAVNHPLPPGAKTSKRREKPGRMKIYVGNLAFYTSTDTVSEVFSEFGDIYDVYIPRDIETDRSRGFGFVSMQKEAGQAAIESLNGCELDGRMISVNEARPREEMQRAQTVEEAEE